MRLPTAVPTTDNVSMGCKLHGRKEANRLEWPDTHLRKNQQHQHPGSHSKYLNPPRAACAEGESDARQYAQVKTDFAELLGSTEAITRITT